MNLSIQAKKRLTVGAIILVLGLSAALMVVVSRHIDTVEHLISSLGIAGPMLSIALYGLLGASPVPSEPLTLVNGAVFGPLMGTLIAGTGNTLAAVVEYFIGAGIDNAADFAKKRDDLPFGLGKLPVDSVWFLIGAPADPRLRCEGRQRGRRDVPRAAVALPVDDRHPDLHRCGAVRLRRFQPA